MGMPPFKGSWFSVFDGYVYGNQTAVQLFTAAYHVSFDNLDELRASRQRAHRDLPLGAGSLPATWARDLDRYLLRLGRLAAADLERCQ